MPPQPVVTDFGLSPLPDVGELSYNGITFSSLFKSKVTSNLIQDNASRTVKWAEWTIEVEGYVTLSNNVDVNTDDDMTAVRLLLDQDGGELDYVGRGIGRIRVNPQGPGQVFGGNVLRDLAWGPKPKVLDFQPLGAGRGAAVRWSVTTCIPEIPGVTNSIIAGAAPGPFKAGGAIQRQQVPVVQFNEEIGVTYDDLGYSSRSIKGTLEIGMTRTIQESRAVQTTADAVRAKFLGPVGDGIDLTRFRVTRRHFDYSRDKRTMEWEFVVEELPPMGLPAGCVAARGTYSVRSKSVTEWVQWVCSLRCTYAVRKDEPRRMAWAAFVSMWKFRMEQSKLAMPALNNNQPGPQQPGANSVIGTFGRIFLTPFVVGAPGIGAVIAGKALLNELQRNDPAPAPPPGGGRLVNQNKVNVIPLHFGFDEGLYLDSKEMSFEATWLLLAPFTDILAASGVWRAPPGTGGNTWAMSVQDMMGYHSYEIDALDPSGDVIVDFGGP